VEHVGAGRDEGEVNDGVGGCRHLGVPAAVGRLVAERDVFAARVEVEEVEEFSEADGCSSGGRAHQVAAAGSRLTVFSGWVTAG
jgi:hypothetical protein